MTEEEFKLVRRKLPCCKRTQQEEREKMLIWSEEWFDDKRKNNDMWRMNQDELSNMFLEEFCLKWVLKEVKQ